MKKDTKNLISLLWVSKGYMLVGTALAVLEVLWRCGERTGKVHTRCLLA